jgi:hypothetical protein
MTRRRHPSPPAHQPFPLAPPPAPCRADGPCAAVGEEKRPRSIHVRSIARDTRLTVSPGAPPPCLHTTSHGVSAVLALKRTNSVTPVVTFLVEFPGQGRLGGYAVIPASLQPTFKDRLPSEHGSQHQETGQVRHFPSEAASCSNYLLSPGTTKEVPGVLLCTLALDKICPDVVSVRI